MPESHKAEQLVAVGASAGGIEAVGTLLSRLPVDLRAAVVVAQHLDPSKISHLPEILQRRTELRVKSVADREPLQAGVVYLVPADRHVSITDHEVSLSTSSAERPTPSVNLLLSTASEAFGERLVAVVLSGMGSDGAMGAASVKRSGGTVIIQNPETARYASMPRSLAPGLVDIVADLEDIGPIVAQLVAGEYEEPAGADAERDVQGFLEELRLRRGIDFNSYKPPTIRRRLQRRRVAVGAANLDEYRAYLDQHPEEESELVRTFLIKVTEFFRDQELCTYLRERLIPRLVLESRKHNNQLRVWSAGCATGQEAYSLAILIAEVLGNDLERFGVRVFATDLDAEAVEFARRGVYPKSAVAQVPQELIGRYFFEIDGEYEVNKRIRGTVIFGEHDLAQRAPFPGIDLILCRNVLMYFAPDLQRRALQLFAFSLRDAGVLVLGKAETITPLPEFFASDDPHLHVYHRQGGRNLIPRLMDTSLRGKVRSSVARLAATGGAAQRFERGSPQPRPHSSRFDALPLGIVIVDRRYDVREINPAAQRLLDIHVPSEGQDLLHLLTTVEVTPVRAAIDAAFNTGQPASVEALPISDPASGRSRYVEIMCHPGASSASDDAVVMTVSDVTSIVLSRQSDSAGYEKSAGEGASPEARLEQLIVRNRELTAANEALLQANREHSVAREELTVDNAAVQSSAEEVETLNEELHATNEELETLNEEMQSTIEELNATNDDLTARSSELQRLSQEHDAQRRQLAGMLDSIGDAVVVLNARGEIVLTNATYQRLFGARQPLLSERREGEPVPAVESLQQRALRGEIFTTEFMATTLDGARRWMEATACPIQTESEPQSIIAIRDITDRNLRRLQEQFLATASHELRTPLTALSGYLQLIQRELTHQVDITRLRLSVDIAYREVQRLARLTEELVDAERLRTGVLHLERRQLDLASILRLSVQTVQPLTRGQTVQLHIDGERLPVEGDADRLEQVFLNLLTNAITYAPDTERIDVLARRLDDQVEVQVQDYGPGISAADLPQVFDRFYRVSSGQAPGGMGLGLYIAAQVVGAHNGSIDVASEEGFGTTFTVRLPLRLSGKGPSASAS